ncbi:MAG TPA: rod shape-determining protein MreD [Candidatus Angelobacter sp.]
MSVAVTYTSREEIEVHKFSWLVSVGVPLAAVFIQVFFPIRVKFLTVFDLPLLVTIYFAVARRKPIAGLITGALVGTLQDAFGHRYIGLNGIAKTIIGFLASSLGVKIDVENPGSRFLMTIGFYLLHQVILTGIGVALVGVREPWMWGHTLITALANGLLAVVLFVALDRLRMRG